MRIESHFESGGFAALRPEWNQLVHRSRFDNLFLTWEWQSTWWKHLGNGSLLLLGFREDSGRLVGIAPLFVALGENGQPVLSLNGCRDVSDYLDLIVEPGHEELVYGALLEYLEEDAPLWTVADFCNLPQESQTLELFRESAQARGYQTLIEVEDVCPIISLPESWDDYLMSLDKKQRHEVRRKLRKADAEAETRFLIIGPDQDLSPAMDAFIDLHAKSAPEKDEFMEPRMQHFFRDVAQQLHDRGWLQLAFIEMDGQKASTLLNFNYGDAILVYNSGYDPSQFRHLSPGIVVTARCIEHAIALGRAKFDFLRGDEIYKYRFGASDTEVRRLRFARQGVDLATAC
jgi:CelD/BcsL family acetyltransferase involved in cellulose biosynthesis